MLANLRGFPGDVIMADRGSEIGLVGLGVMGQNFALNIADHGFSVATYDRTLEKTRRFVEEGAAGRDIRPGYSLPEFVGALRRPRAIVVLVPAGNPVDSIIESLLPYLEPGDLIIDSGNSHFSDTNRRSRSLSEKALLFIGMGISGGEKGARFGPSLMPGGPREGYERVRSILEATAAKVEGEACVTYLGPGSAGHYVKMVHNGIEYGLMQLISESYDLMKRGLHLDNEKLHDVYRQWNQGELNSYLMEITAHIFRQKDEKTGKFLLDLILDRAKQKGTGKWTSIDAFDLQVPIPTIDIAVSMRDLSAHKEERKTAAEVFRGTENPPGGMGDYFLTQLKDALHAATIITYAQGMALLKQASSVYEYKLNLETVARIWRGGCIIRAALLEDFRSAYQAQPDLPNLLLDPQLGQEILAKEESLREVICAGARWGLPVPGLMASLGYFDAYRSATLPTNLIQAQRDYFGAHTYERADVPGVFHTQWGEA
jgi:6-phosphogluconate dehydrogenase